MIVDDILTVILPAAGEGNRLGLKTPKELFEIVPGVKLIDFALKHILAATQRIKIKVVVVIKSWKTDVVNYVARQLPEIEVEMVLFNNNYHEWPGSVYSAEEYFSNNNLVLLPDSYLSLSSETHHIFPAIEDNDGKCLGDWVIETLSRYSVAFGCIPCKDSAKLQSLGAVTIEEDRVIAFQDKPRIEENPVSFNGFWGCYGFRKTAAKPLYNYLVHSVWHQPLPLNSQLFYPMAVIPIAHYEDLGTWESIERFRKQKIG